MRTSARIAAKRSKCSNVAKNANFVARYAATSIESNGKTYSLNQVVVGNSLYGRVYGGFSGSDFIVIKMKKKRGASHAYAFYTYTKPPARKKSAKKK